MISLWVNESPNEVWQVLEQSGYVKLWVPNDIHDAIQDDYAMALASGPHVTMLARGERDAPICTAMATEEAPGAWLLHQLGKTPKCEEPHVVIDTIRRMVQLVDGAHEAESYTVFAEAAAPHTARLFTDFAWSLPRRADGNELDEVTVYRCRTGAHNGGVVPPRAPIPALMSCNGGGPAGGANLSGLLNRCRFVTPPGSNDERIEQLEGALAYYRGCGSRQFTFIDAHPNQLVPHGFERFGAGIRWTFDRTTMLSWLQYLEGLRR